MFCASETLRLADSAMNVSTVFLFLFTSYSVLYLIFHIWLFSALDLPVSFLSHQAEEAGIDEVFKRAETREMEEVYWCWWGHRQGPIGHFFCLVAGLGGWIGVSEASISSLGVARIFWTVHVLSEIN